MTGCRTCRKVSVESTAEPGVDKHRTMQLPIYSLGIED